MDKNKIIMFVIAGLVILIILDQIMKAIGLKKNKNDKLKDEAAASLRTNDFFDPMFYRGKAFSSLGKSVANEYAKEIHSSLGMFNDDEEAIYALFGRLKCKYNISEIAESYYEYYKKQMLPEILSHLNKSEMAILNAIIEKLPEKS